MLILFTGGSAPLHAGLHPPGPEAGTPQSRHPPGADNPKPGIPPGADPPPQDKRQAPPGADTPQAGTPQDQRQAPPGPEAGTPPKQAPPRSRHSPWEQPPPKQASPWSRHPLLEQVPLRSACWEIRATSARYASFWNAILV